MKKTDYATVAAAVLSAMAVSFVHAQNDERPLQEPIIMLNGGDGIRNGGFEDWVDGVPLFWDATGAVPDLVQRETGDMHVGRGALRCAQGKPWSGIRQRVTVYGDLGGRTLRVTAWAKVPKPDVEMAFIILEDGTRVVGKPHPGDGKWHEVVIEYLVPKGAAFAWFDLVLGRIVGQDRPCLFDEVQLTVQ